MENDGIFPNLWGNSREKLVLLVMISYEYMHIRTPDESNLIIKCKNGISQPSNRQWVVKEPFINSQMHVWPWADPGQLPKGAGVHRASRPSQGPSFSSTFVCMGAQWLFSLTGLPSEANAHSDEADYCLESFNIFGHLKLIYRYHIIWSIS